MAKGKLILRDLSTMVDRIGVSGVAKRFSVTPSTIRRWNRHGVPESKLGIVTRSFIRHEASRKAWITRREYIKLGITRIHGLKELDKVLGVEEGHTKDRLATRRLFWEEKHGFLPPSAVEYHQDHTGAVFYTDVDGEIWRAYTVDGKLFWTRSISLAGYETAEELTSRYGTLTGHSVQIHF